jgi:hypothetical protein
MDGKNLPLLPDGRCALSVPSAPAPAHLCRQERRVLEQPLATWCAVALHELGKHFLPQNSQELYFLSTAIKPACFVGGWGWSNPWGALPADRWAWNQIQKATRLI